MNTQRTLTLCIIIAAAAFSRLLPHPDNVTPVAALALFAGAYFDKKWLAFAVPLSIMLISDMLIGFHNTMWGVYLGFALIVCIGFIVRGRNRLLPITTACVAGSLIFFAVSNFAVWVSSGLYAQTLEGLAQCFIAAIPFYTNTLLGDLFYTSLLFIGFFKAEQHFSWLRIKPLQTA
ncbi:MAG: hypothetical protein LW823_01705 [Rickettsiales bacterium]|jgi:hypothetical protein|nr:hypothetical protein [Rickettsiales bacterium]